MTEEPVLKPIPLERIVIFESMFGSSRRNGTKARVCNHMAKTKDDNGPAHEIEFLSDSHRTFAYRGEITEVVTAAAA